MATNGNEAIWKDVIVTIGTKNFAGITSFDYNLAVDMIETTNMNTENNVKTNKAGRYSETFSVEGIHDPNKGTTTMTDFWDLRALATAGTEATVRMYEDDNTNGKYVEMTCLVNSLGKKNQDNAAVNISCAFTITGASSVGAVT